MKKKYTIWQILYLFAVKAVITGLILSMLVPCLNFVVYIIDKTGHMDAFFIAHCTDNPEILFDSILGITASKEDI